eukprot:1739809-Rhodomonas_salina.1
MCWVLGGPCAVCVRAPAIAQMCRHIHVGRAKFLNPHSHLRQVKYPGTRYNCIHWLRNACASEKLDSDNSKKSAIENGKTLFSISSTEAP